VVLAAVALGRGDSIGPPRSLTMLDSPKQGNKMKVSTSWS